MCVCEQAEETDSSSKGFLRERERERDRERERVKEEERKKGNLAAA